MRDRATFAAFTRAQRHRRGPLWVIRVDSPTGRRDDPPRVAYQVGRQVGGAVQRNRVRRRLRAALRAQAERLEPGAAYLVGAGRGVGDRTGAELEHTLRGLLEKVEDSTT